MTGSFVRRSVAALGAIALVTALSGCTDDSDADADDGNSPSASVNNSPTPSASASPDTGPTEPVAPKGMAEPTKRGAELLVRYYWEVVDYAQWTGDVRTLKTLANPNCSVCDDTVRGLRGIYENGGFLKGAKHHLSNFHSVKFRTQDRDTFRVDATLTRTRQRGRASTGAKLESVPKSESEVFFLLSPGTRGDLVVEYWEVKPQS